MNNLDFHILAIAVIIICVLIYIGTMGDNARDNKLQLANDSLVAKIDSLENEIDDYIVRQMDADTRRDSALYYQGEWLKEFAKDYPWIDKRVRASLDK